MDRLVVSCPPACWLRLQIKSWHCTALHCIDLHGMAWCSRELRGHTFFNFSLAAFSFFSHFLDDLSICFETILMLINSSSSDTLFPMVTDDDDDIRWVFQLGRRRRRRRGRSMDVCNNNRIYNKTVYCGATFKWIAFYREATPSTPGYEYLHFSVADLCNGRINSEFSV
jgi:hypothetical protein